MSTLGGKLSNNPILVVVIFVAPYLFRLVLEFNGSVNTIKVMSSQSIYLRPKKINVLFLFFFFLFFLMESYNILTTLTEHLTISEYKCTNDKGGLC